MKATLNACNIGGAARTVAKYNLTDPDSGTTVSCTVEFANGKLWVELEGYGDGSSQPGCGVPLGIEYYENAVWVTVWGDINNSEPTERVCLDGARETNRLCSEPIGRKE